MTPSPAQIRQALQNHLRAPRTIGAKIKAAIEHSQRRDDAEILENGGSYGQKEPRWRAG